MESSSKESTSNSKIIVLKSLSSSSIKDIEPKSDSNTIELLNTKYSNTAILKKLENENFSNKKIGHFSKKQTNLLLLNKNKFKSNEYKQQVNCKTSNIEIETKNLLDNLSLNISKEISLEPSFETLEKSFNLFFKNHFIDSVYNLVDYYEEYLVQNLKVIKKMQFYFNQSSYLESFKIIKEKIGCNIILDYSQPYLIFDLDETLIHTELFSLNQKYDFTISFLNKDSQGNDLEEIYGVYMRPNVYQFLESVKGKFKLGLMTASVMIYAKEVLEKSKLESFFDFVIDREYCIKVHKFYIKDLGIFNSENSKLNCILIDNNIYSFASCLDQGTLISSFTSDYGDEELKDLENYIDEHLLPNKSNIIKANNNYYLYRELMNNLNLESDETF